MTEFVPKPSFLNDITNIIKQNIPLVIMAIMNGTDVNKMMPIFIIPLILCLLNYTSIIYTIVSKYWEQNDHIVKDSIVVNVADRNPACHYDVQFVEHISLFVDDFCSEFMKKGVVDDYLFTNNKIDHTDSYYLLPKLKLTDGFKCDIVLGDVADSTSIMHKIEKSGFVIPEKIITLGLDKQQISIYIFDREEESKNNKGEVVKIKKLQVEIIAKKSSTVSKFIELIIGYATYKKNNIANFKLVKKSYSSNTTGDIYKVENDVNVIKTYDNVFLSKVNYDLITQNIKSWIKDKNKLLNEGIPHKLGFLLYGEPGCGKSSLIFAVANETKKHIYSFDLKEFTGPSFRTMMSKISNAVIIFEDIDAHEFTHDRKILAERAKERNKKFNLMMRKYDDSDDFSFDSPTVPGDDKSKSTKIDTTDTSISFNKDKLTLDIMLDILDGYLYLKDCIIFITTNHKEILDSALIRPGRIDHQIEFKLTDELQFASMFEFFTNKKYKNIDPDFIFPENKYSTAYIINTIIIPNRYNPNIIIKMLSDND